MDLRESSRPELSDTPQTPPDPDEYPDTPREMDLDESADLPRETPDIDENADTPRQTPPVRELLGATKHTIACLGSLYSLEASAVRSYDMALASPCLPFHRQAFELNRSSHEERIGLLRNRIELEGGQVPQTPSISDSLLELMADAAVTYSSSSAVNALERREHRWLNEYNEALKDLERQSLQFVEQELVPRQLQSHGAIRAINQRNGHERETAE